MGTTDAPQRGRPEKRRAILDAARAVFLAKGYTRSSVDAIGARAKVSKRTVYNHFADKTSLFLAVVEDTVAPVREEFEALLDRHLPEGRVRDVRGALERFGIDLVRTSVLHPDHAALLRVVIAEAPHVPEVIDAWRSSGPGPGQAKLTERLVALAADGLLDVDDAGAAARHLTALVANPPQSRSFFGVLDLPDEELEALVVEGVDAFLRIYGPPSPDGGRLAGGTSGPSRPPRRGA